MLAKDFLYRSKVGINNQLPDWCIFSHRLGEAVVSIKGVSIVLVCPDEEFSALFSAVGALTKSEINHSDYLKSNPCVYIADSHNHNCEKGKRYLFKSIIFEGDQCFYEFVGAESLLRKVSGLEFDKIVIPQKNQNPSDWIKLKNRSFTIPVYSERDTSWKTISVVGNKSELLKAAQKKWFYSSNGLQSISCTYSIEGLVENSKAHKSIHIDPSSSRQQQNERFEIWSGKIPPIENKSDRSLIVCLDRTTRDLNEQIETFISRSRILGQRGLRPLTLKEAPIEHPLSSILKEAPPSLGVCAFGYMD